jgi:glutamate-ammonia-ligase adenylyltransferase
VFVVASLWNRLTGRGKRRIPLAVFALGKLGTQELGFDADLDLMFVAGTSARGGVFEETATKAEKLIQDLTAVSPEGRLYDVDLRLRPEGKSAPLVAEAQAYANYLSARASLWERQSLTRLRFIAGDATVGSYVAGVAAHHAYEEPLPRGWTEEIVAMRRRMETRSRTRAATFVDLKLGPGGMADCEFIAQMIQLRFGGEHPELRGARTAAVLRSAAHGVLTPGETDELVSSYGMERRLELLLRTGLEEKGAILPEGEPLDLLARLYDGSSGPALASRLAGTMKRVRAIFLDVAGRLA